MYKEYKNVKKSKILLKKYKNLKRIQKGNKDNAYIKCYDILLHFKVRWPDYHYLSVINIHWYIKISTVQKARAYDTGKHFQPSLIFVTSGVAFVGRSKTNCCSKAHTQYKTPQSAPLV